MLCVVLFWSLTSWTTPQKPILISGGLRLRGGVDRSVAMLPRPCWVQVQSQPVPTLAVKATSSKIWFSASYFVAHDCQSGQLLLTSPLPSCAPAWKSLVLARIAAAVLCKRSEPRNALSLWGNSIPGWKWSWEWQGGGSWCLHVVQGPEPMPTFWKGTSSHFISDLFFFTCVKWDGDVVLTSLRRHFQFHRSKVFYRTVLLHFFWEVTTQPWNSAFCYC